MPPSNSDIRPALEMLPQNVLKNILGERDIEFTSRYSEELIERLLEEDWTWDEQQQLIERVARVEREKNPKSRYIARIDAISPGIEQGTESDRVRHVLDANAAEFEDDELVEDGFELVSSDSSIIEGIHWTKSEKYTLTPRQEIINQPTLYNTGFELHLDEDMLFIDSTLSQKARSLITEFREGGISVQELEYTDLPGEVANQHVQDFVDNVETTLRDRNPQERIAEEYDQSPIEVSIVKMLLDDMDLKNVRIGGRTDIIQHPKVVEFLDESDARIVRLEGDFELDGRFYKFKVGQSDGMGHISVEKKGTVEERPELLDDAFDFLYSFFEEHYMAV